MKVFNFLEKEPAPQTWKEVAQLYGVSIRTMYNLRKKYKLTDLPSGKLMPCHVDRIFKTLGNPNAFPRFYEVHQ
jgi:hypothetical protein